MDRYAIFVDAGYLFAAAGDLCFGTSRRHDLSLHARKATEFLRCRCHSHGKQAHLRTYWYDAAQDAVPTDDQLQLGEQRGVKLRLGRLTKEGQKGVDARIVRDLIVLARNGAVTTAYLMSGDEDVREGVAEAQEFGVSVVLLGIEPPAGRVNQAATLVREADDFITLTRRECAEFMSRSTAKVDQIQVSIPVAVGADASATDFGEAYGRAIRGARDSEAVAKILADRPRIPRSVDVWLLKEAARRFGDPVAESIRRESRAGFWEGIRGARRPTGMET